MGSIFYIYVLNYIRTEIFIRNGEFSSPALSYGFNCCYVANKVTNEIFNQ